LAKARKLLQDRLTARGVTLSAALCALALSQSETSSAVAATLAKDTIHAALAFAAGIGAGVVSANAVAMAEGVLRGMFMAKLKSKIAMALAETLKSFYVFRDVFAFWRTGKYDKSNREISRKTRRTASAVRRRLVEE
jgi:hypothetical protein